MNYNFFLKTGKEESKIAKSKVVYSLIFLSLFLFSFNLVSSLPNDADSTIDFTYPDVINYSLIPTVNSSEYWDDLDTPSDITYDDLSAGDVNALGYTGTFNFIDGVVGRLSIDGDPWYLGGTDLELGQDLYVDRDSYLNNTYPQDTLTSSLGSGALRWLWLYVQNINAEEIDAFNLHLSENLTVDGYINGVNISNISDTYVDESGDTMTGDLTMSNSTIVIDKDKGIVGDGYNNGGRNYIWALSSIYNTRGISYYEGSPDYIFIHPHGTTTTSGMVVTDGGNVGIGLVNPPQKLYVNAGNIYVNTGAIYTAYAGAYKTVLGYDGSQNGNLYMRDGSNVLKVMISTGADSYFNGGNVGIGTTTPSHELNVVGSANITANITANYFIGDGSQLTGISEFNESLYNDTYVIKTGDTMTGDLNMGSNKVTNQVYELSNEAGLVSYWAFEENANDYVGSNDGTVIGATNTSDGRIGRAYDFDGTNFINLGTDESIRNNLNEGMSISAWINYQGSTTALESIIGCTKSTGATGYYLAIYQNDIRLALAGGSTYAIGQTTDTIAHNEWIQVVATYNGSDIEIYKNGVIQGLAIDTPGSGSFSSIDTVTIGAIDSGLVNLFNGSIDEVKIYNRSLSATEVEYEYLRGINHLDKSQNIGLTANITANYFIGNGSRLTDVSTSVSGNSINGTELADTINLDANMNIMGYDFAVNTSNLYVDVSEDRVGIGTATPDAPLHVKTDASYNSIKIGSGTKTGIGESGGAMILFADANDYIAFSTDGGAGTQALKLDLKTGNVGIGTTTPTHELNVVGSANITKNLNVEGNLTGNQYYGGMWFYNQSGFPISLNSTYQKITFWDEEPLQNGFIFHNSVDGKLELIGEEGNYQVIWNMGGDGVNNHIYNGFVYVNEVQWNNTIGYAVGQQSNLVQMNGFGFIDIKKHDNVTIRIADVGGTTTGTAYNGNINLVRVGK